MPTGPTRVEMVRKRLVCLTLLSLLRTLIKNMGRDSQNFFRQIPKIFVTLGLNILRLLRLKVVSIADIMKG